MPAWLRFPEPRGIIGAEANDSRRQLQGAWTFCAEVLPETYGGFPAREALRYGDVAGQRLWPDTS